MSSPQRTPNAAPSTSTYNINNAYHFNPTTDPFPTWTQHASPIPSPLFPFDPATYIPDSALNAIDMALFETQIQLGQVLDRKRNELEMYHNPTVNYKMRQYMLAVLEVVLGIRIPGAMPRGEVDGIGVLRVRWEFVEGA